MKKEKWLILMSAVLLLAAAVPFIISVSSPKAVPAEVFISFTDEGGYPSSSAVPAEVYYGDEVNDSSSPNELTADTELEDYGETAPSSEQPTTTTSTGKATAASKSEAPATSASNKPPKKELSSAGDELRAIWIPYMSLTELSEEKIDKLVARSKKYGYNAIMFHVRPFGDAMYSSRYFPWSHIITGKQGEAPKGGFDPLEYMCRKAHENGIAVHAWVNPLRIQLKGGTLPSTLSSDNPYTLFRSDSSTDNDHYVVDYKDGKFYNPGEAAVRKLIVNGMVEIVQNYDVDGVHWDDYFYPAKGSSFDDSVSYNSYAASGGTKSLADWRKENINKLVKMTYSAIKAVDSSVVFGISPAGNIGNCLNAGADVYEWGSSDGYVDYICPQIYWTFDNTVAPYAETCAKWRKIVSNPKVKFYIGLALYKAGSDADGGKWQRGDNIIASEVEYARANGIDADGFMVYSYEYLTKSKTKTEVENLTKLFS